MNDDDGGAPPPFQPEQALQQLRRALRDLKLGERGNGYELRGRRVAELTAGPASIQGRMARKPALTPEWDRQTIASAGELRKWLDELKRRLARWSAED